MPTITYNTKLAQAISDYTKFQTELKRLKETPQAPESESVGEETRKEREAAFIALGTVLMKSYWPKTSDELDVMASDAEKAVRATKDLLEPADQAK
jgi:hypothetical protein